MNKKSILFSVLATAILATFLWGFTTKTASEKGILTMQVVEYTSVYAKQLDNAITIVYEDDNTEKVELKNLIFGSDFSTNLITINQNLNKILAKGYKLSTTSQAVQDGILIKTYTFIKE